MSHIEHMFEGEKRSVRTAILVLVMASMPVETHVDHISEIDLSSDAANATNTGDDDANLDHTDAIPAANSWTKTVIMSLIAELDLSEDYYDGYLNLLRTNYESVTMFEIKDSSDVESSQGQQSGSGSGSGSSDEEEEKRQQLSTLIKSFKAVIMERSAGAVAAATADAGEPTLQSHLAQTVAASATTAAAAPVSGESGTEYTPLIAAIPVDPHRLRMQVVIEVLVFLVVHLYYDARGRQTVRNLTYLLECSPTDLILCEYVLAHTLSELLMASKRGKGDGATKSKGSKAVRYAKIGAASVGVGALLAITGGLAAPAIAAAAVVAFGSGGAVVAGAFATVTVLGTVFGATGAGLAGYKMSRRTSGLTEFSFEQPMLAEAATELAEENSEEKQRGEDEGAESEQKLAVMIMISGWMKEKDDYKTAFGVLPPDDCIGTKERLARFYSQHNPTKLRSLKEEVKQFKKNPAAYQEALLDIYNVDVMARSSLLPSPYPSANSNSECGLWRNASEHAPHYVAHMSRCVARRTAPIPVDGEAREKGEEKERMQTDAAAEDEAEDEEIAGQYGRGSIGRGSTGSPGLGVGLGAGKTSISDLEAEVQRAQETGQDAGQEQVARMNANVARYRERYWNWRQQPELASVYELYLLRYETALQVELGHSIEALIASLKTSAVQKMLTVTVLSAMMSALLLPITLVKLTDVIDNTWTLAIERADMAGIELANALASRLQGTRPVTLVGHSIGARVIYSCLKELYRLKLEAVRRRDEASIPGAAEKARKRRTGPFGMGLWSRGDALDDDVVEYSAGPAPVADADADADVGGSSAPPPPPAVVSAAADSPDSFFSFKSFKSKLPFGGSDEKASSSSSSSSGAGNKDSSKEESAEATPEELDDEVFKFDGILQDVVLLGAPVNSRSPNWRRFRSLVSGRFINGYSSNDMVLRLLYRYERWQVNVAGVQPISGVVTAVEDVRSTVSAVGSSASSAATAVKSGASTVVSTASSAGSAISRGASSAVGRLKNKSAPADAPVAAQDSVDQAPTDTDAPDPDAPDPSGRSHCTNAIGIENVDLSFMIDKHTDYCYKMRSILQYLNFKGADVDPKGLSAACLMKSPDDEEKEEEEKEKEQDNKEKEKDGWYPGKIVGNVGKAIK